MEKKREQLKAGDRVRRRAEATKGVVKSVVDNERVMVIWDQASTPYICHNELLIRLVRRREWVGHWDRAGAFKQGAIVFCPSDDVPDSYCETIGRVREIPAKKGAKK